MRNRGLLTTEGRTELLRIAEEMRSGKRDFAMAEIEVRRPDVGEWIWTKQSYTVLEKDENGLKNFSFSKVKVRPRERACK